MDPIRVERGGPVLSEIKVGGPRPMQPPASTTYVCTCTAVSLHKGMNAYFTLMEMNGHKRQRPRISLSEVCVAQKSVLNSLETQMKPKIAVD